MDNIVFETGKYTDKTYKYVRINHPEYFTSLLCKRVGNVIVYFDFITYCLSILSSKNHNDTKKNKGKIFKSWDSLESLQLKKLHDDGKNVIEISQIHERSCGSILSKLKK